MLFIFLIGQSPQMSICTIASIFGIFIFPESNTLVISIIPCPFSLIINGVNCYVVFHYNSFRFRHRVNALGGGEGEIKTIQLTTHCMIYVSVQISSVFNPFLLSQLRFRKTGEVGVIADFNIVSAPGFRQGCVVCKNIVYSKVFFNFDYLRQQLCQLGELGWGECVIHKLKCRLVTSRRVVSEL